MEERGLDSAAAAERLAAGDALLVDVWDPASYEAAPMEGAVHPTDRTTGPFLEDADRERTEIECCHHGNVSLGGAVHVMEQGFQDVYSLMGGFEEWKETHPSMNAWARCGALGR